MEFDANPVENSTYAMADVAVASRRDRRDAMVPGGGMPTEEFEGASEVWLVLRRTVCFFGMLALVATGLNALITFGLRHLRTGQYGVSNRIIRGQINAQIVINGSSRALSGFDPRILEAVTGLSAYNIGRNGSQTDMQLAVLRTYLEHNRKPEIVVQSLDSFSFEATREVYNPAQYVPYLYDEELWRPLRRINPDIWKSRYVPLYGYVVDDMNMSWVLGLGSLFGWSPHEDLFLGFNPRPKKWSDEFESFKAENPKGVNWPIDPEGERSLEDLVQLCQERGIQLIFVFPPEYSEMQGLTKNRKEVFAGFHRLSAKYHFPIWDYSGWEHASDTAYFQNSQHLNEDGAEVFSADLANRLKEYLAAEAQEAGSLSGPSQAVLAPQSTDGCNKGKGSDAAACAGMARGPEAQNGKSSQ